MCCSRQLAIEYRTREGEWGAESGEKEDCLVPARDLVLFFVVNPGTPTCVPTHTYSALHTTCSHKTLPKTDGCVHPRRAPAISVGYPTPGVRARPRATSASPPPHNTNPAHDADVTLHRARGDNHTRIPHRHMDPTLFHTRLLYN